MGGHEHLRQLCTEDAVPRGELRRGQPQNLRTTQDLLPRKSAVLRGF